jgi:S1-C subfamily serine protease
MAIFSCKNGGTQGQLCLAVEYSTGNFIPISIKKYIFRLNKSADQKLPKALNDLGLYFTGEVNDPKKALSLFNEAADLGVPEAHFNLGTIYAAGAIVERDIEKSSHHLNKALQGGLVETRAELNQLEASIKTVLLRERTIIKEIVKETSAPQDITAEQVFLDITEKVYKLIVANVAQGPDGVEVSDKGTGSAVAITKEIALTNCHVVKDADFVMIQKSELNSLAKVVKRYANDDVCFIRSVDLELNPVGEYRTLNSLRVGDITYAIGSPSGLENTLSAGHISGIRSMEGRRWVQTSAAISPGSSGGGLFDKEGSLIGITTFKLKETENLNFAAPAQRFVEEVKSSYAN